MKKRLVTFSDAAFRIFQEALKLWLNCTYNRVFVFDDIGKVKSDTSVNKQRDGYHGYAAIAGGWAGWQLVIVSPIVHLKQK